jgi:hypothetical protein
MAEIERVKMILLKLSSWIEVCGGGFQLLRSILAIPIERRR